MFTATNNGKTFSNKFLKNVIVNAFTASGLKIKEFDTFGNVKKRLEREFGWTFTKG